MIKKLKISAYIIAVVVCIGILLTPKSTPENTIPNILWENINTELYAEGFASNLGKTPLEERLYSVDIFAKGVKINNVTYKLKEIETFPYTKGRHVTQIYTTSGTLISIMHRNGHVISIISLSKDGSTFRAFVRNNKNDEWSI